MLFTIKNTALASVAFLLALGAGVGLSAQQQPNEQRQQIKQDQRLLYEYVYRHDQETLLEDPAITNQLTDQLMLPDSNEQNVESRELTLFDLRRPRFVPAPVAGEGMQFVPGRGYVAGRTEEATEPGMSVLAPTLGFQTNGGLISGQNLTGDTQFQAVNWGDNTLISPAGVNPYVQAPSTLLSLDPFQTENRTTGIGSALERRPSVSPPAPEPSLWQNELTAPTNRTAVSKLPGVPVRRYGTGLGRTGCEVKIDPATIRDRGQMESRLHHGCLTTLARPNGKADEGRN